MINDTIRFVFIQKKYIHNEQKTLATNLQALVND